MGNEEGEEKDRRKEREEEGNVVKETRRERKGKTPSSQHRPNLCAV